MSKRLPYFDIAVIGAGVFGAWTAWHLQQRSQRVLLVDAYGPAHARASSGGESRMTRGSYGPDEIYTRMAYDSLAQWKWLSERSGLPIFHDLGVLFFFGQREKYVDETLRVHEKLRLPTQLLGRSELKDRYPQARWDDVALGILEPEFGALMARRAVQTLVQEFQHAGGVYWQSAVAPPSPGVAAAPETLRSAEGRDLAGAARHVFACGPWLPKLFPVELGGRIFPTRQEVFFFAPPAGSNSFSPEKFPGWADFNVGDIYYGFPDLEARGFKIAHDQHGPAIDPDHGRPHRERRGPRRRARLPRAALSHARAGPARGDRACASTRTARTATC